MTKKKAKPKARVKAKTVAHPRWKYAVVYLHALASRCDCSEQCRTRPLYALVMCDRWLSRLVSAESPFSFCTMAVRESGAINTIYTIVKMLNEDPSLRDEQGLERFAGDVQASFVRAIRLMFAITESELVALAKEKGWNGRPLVKLPAAWAT